MRIRSPGGLAAAVALCFVGVSIVRNHQQRSSDLAEIKGKIAKLNTRTGQTSAKAPAKDTPRPKQTGDGSDGSAITLLGSNPMVQVNDQITNFQTLMLNIDNPDVDKGVPRGRSPVLECVPSVLEHVSLPLLPGHSRSGHGLQAGRMSSDST